jgi:hypothetical protein
VAMAEHFDRPSFVHLANNELLDACRAVSEVSEDEDRYVLAARVETELRLLVGDLLTTLPDRPGEDEDIPRGTGATVGCDHPDVERAHLSHQDPKQN